MSVINDRFLKWLSAGAGIILGGILLFGIDYYPVAVDFLNRIPDQNQEKFLDMHTHVACLGPDVPVETDCYVSPDMRSSYKFSIYLKAFGMTEESLKTEGGLAIFDHLAEKIQSSQRIKAAVVLAMDGFVNRTTGALDWQNTQIYVPNEFVLKGLKDKPRGVFYFGASVNPYRKDALQRLVQMKNEGAVLIKWIPSIMNIDPADPQLIEYYKKLVELDLVLLTHTGRELSFSGAKDELCDPLRLKLPLSLGVKIIAAHVATTGENQNESDFSRLSKLMDEPKYKDQLFADISAITQFNRIKMLKGILKNPVFKGHLVNGTDWPLIEVSVGINSSLSLNLTPYHLYNLPFLNLGLDSSQIRILDSISNTFDRDVRMKEFYGVTTEIFGLAEKILTLPKNPY